MPSVEMRRSTRVFVPKAKDGELVRVLRSGRKLWVDNDGDNAGDWCPLIENKGKLKPTTLSSPRGINLRTELVSPAGCEPMDIDDGKLLMEPSKTLTHRFAGNRMVVNVYNRKRKRSDGKISVDSSHSSIQKGDRKGDRRFGLYFVRRKRRKVVIEHEERDDRGLISIVVDSSSTNCGIFPRFLRSVLGYLSRQMIGLDELSMLLLSSSIFPVFASSGIHFSQGRTFTQRTGICRIFGARQFIPLFTVDFAAVPFSFLHLHATMFFRSVRVSCLCSIDLHNEDEDTDIDDSLSYINDKSDLFLRRYSITDKDNSKCTKAVRAISGVGRQGSRNMLYRTGVVTRSRSKRRRRSLRNRKARNPLLLVLQEPSESIVSNHLSVKRKATTPAVSRDLVLRSSARKDLSSETSVPKSSSLTMNVDVGSQYCLANLLVVEIDRGYRVEGAEIVLDVSASNEWILAVKKNGSTRYSLKTLRELRCNHITNRFTHALIWVAENGWKLEFPDRKDWCVFKELYKLCWEKNAIPASPIVKNIPVPGVCEVINSWDSTISPFKMPESYIKTFSDELSKALLSRTANYDMDSEDEEWLSELNNGLGEADLVSDETFELMIDAFEKASYCRPEDCNDENDAASICQDLASSLVVGEVYRYWIQKREQKKVPLIRVFQLNQPRGAQLITKPVLRKKRSLKRSATQSFQCGRGKDSSILQAIVAEQKIVEERYSDIALEEAEDSATRSMEVAIAKRHRAQFLMENADLAVYRATMALRIADAAQNVETEHASANFLELKMNEIIDR